MKIHNRKTWWNYEKQKYIRRIKQKDKILSIYIIEMDELRKENNRLTKKLNDNIRKSEKTICLMKNDFTCPIDCKIIELCADCTLYNK